MESINKEYVGTSKEFWQDFFTDENNRKTNIQKNLVQSPVWKTINDKQLNDDIRQMLIGIVLNTYFEDMLKYQKSTQQAKQPQQYTGLPQPPQTLFGLGVGQGIGL